MSSRNTEREFSPGTYYHIYTRGVNRRKIFKDTQDYNMFIRYLKLYLLPIELLKKLAMQDIRINKFIHTNLSKEVELNCFALMPNHFHLLVRLKEPKGIESLMRRILTGYAMYFNQKNKRVGHLFENRYKSVAVLTDDYLLYLTRYIHRNPLKSKTARPEFTSMPYYSEKEASWINPESILEHFSSTNPILSYKTFVEEKENEFDLGNLTLEDE